MRAVLRSDVPGEIRGELRVSAGYFERRWEERWWWWWEFFGGINRVAVFVSKCVLQYLRRAKMETDKTSHSSTNDNNLLLRILFQSIVSNDLLSLRGKEINSVCGLLRSERRWRP